MARSEPRRIVCIRPGALGDTLLTLPALALLRKRWPDAEITFVARGETLPLVRASGLAHSTYEYELRAWSALFAEDLAGGTGASDRLPCSLAGSAVIAWLGDGEGLVDAMDVQAGRTLLVRGGTSSVGMAAIALAKDFGLTVLATTRSSAKVDALKANGADDVLIDTGEIASEVRRRVPGGVQYLLDLVGTATLRDSLRAVAPKGVVCNSGILGNAWTFPDFEPMEDIPSTVRLTTYGSSTLTAANGTPALQRIVDGVAVGRYSAQPARVFHLDEIAEAHRTMEENRATGKLVVVTQ